MEHATKPSSGTPRLSFALVSSMMVGIVPFSPDGELEIPNPGSAEEGVLIEDMVSATHGLDLPDETLFIDFLKTFSNFLKTITLSEKSQAMFDHAFRACAILLSFPHGWCSVLLQLFSSQPYVSAIAVLVFCAGFEWFCFCHRRKNYVKNDFRKIY